MVAESAEGKRREIMNEGRQCGDNSAIEALNMQADIDR